MIDVIGGISRYICCLSQFAYLLFESVELVLLQLTSEIRISAKKTFSSNGKWVDEFGVSQTGNMAEVCLLFAAVYFFQNDAQKDGHFAMCIFTMSPPPKSE